ncbi:MAG: hypothetical protein JO333_14825 [Verrucomicrobia bacterium]|nr:hypothetical protein [Verrucomicrobiota bacterium]
MDTSKRELRKSGATPIKQLPGLRRWTAQKELILIQVDQRFCVTGGLS